MLFDIGIGILFGLAMGKTWIFVALGVGFLLIMDSDAIVDFIIHRGTTNSYKHRDLFHRPLVYIPLGMLVLGLATHLVAPQYVQYTVPIVILFAACSLAHFLHDSIGIGWGVQWLWPFSTDHFSFFYQYNVRKKGLAVGRRLPFKPVYIWKDADIDRLEAAYGDKDWFRAIYLSLHPYALAEFALFVVAVIALYFLK